MSLNRLHSIYVELLKSQELIHLSNNDRRNGTTYLELDSSYRINRTHKDKIKLVQIVHTCTNRTYKLVQRNYTNSFF